MAAHPLAAQAGAAMLAQGGNAVDAAVATQLVLGLVEPQSSGLGGGGFLLLWDGQLLFAYDGRETAPAAASETLLLQADGRLRPREQLTASGLAVGVPGLPRLLETVHQRHGRLPWAKLHEAAIGIAEQGFPLGPRLHELLRVDPLLRRDPAALAMFYRTDGQPLPVGTLLRNPAQAAVLRRLAREGADAFYRGAVAEEMLQRVRGHELPGAMTAEDLAGYRVVPRETLCVPWRQWRLCGMPPPAAGLLLSAQLLKLFDAAGGGRWPEVEAVHSYTEAARLAAADRDQYVGDPAFVAPPAGRWASLLEDDYLAQRARLIGSRAATAVNAGQPRGLRQQAWAPQREAVEAGTTHLSVVDAKGMAVALSSSIESAFGNRMLLSGGSGLPGGYFLNHQLTDFSSQARGADGRAVANRPEGGKRPRSSMNPMLVFDAAGRLDMVLGSPGGMAIPHYTARTLLQVLGQGQTPQAALDAPNLAVFGSTLFLEPQGFPSALAAQLRERGHALRELPLTSGLHVLKRSPEGWLAGADPRREGSAAGR